MYCNMKVITHCPEPVVFVLGAISLSRVRSSFVLRRHLVVNQGNNGKAASLYCIF